MKSPGIYLYCILFPASFTIHAQSSLESLLSKVETHDRNILFSMQQLANEKIFSRTNYYPDNPELEYGYLWGSPAETGNRTDLSISQSFDFPSVYMKRLKLARVGMERSLSTHESIRQLTLLKAKLLWIEKVSLNRKRMVLGKRMVEADKISDYLFKQYQMGEISILGYNKARLIRSTLQSELDLLEGESAGLDAEIAKMAVDSTLVIRDTVYHPAVRPVLDSALANVLSDPLYSAYLREVELKDLKRQLAVASSMPKFKAGYYSERIPSLHQQGILLGITLPLWENANRVKAAAGEISSAELAVEKYRADEVTRIQTHYARYISYYKQVEALSSALESSNDPMLLSFAMEKGEISALEYFFETDLYYRVTYDLLLAEKQLYLAEAELTRYRL